MLVLYLSSVRLKEQGILCLHVNNLLDGDLHRHFFYIHILSFIFLFWFSHMILSNALISPVSQLQTEQVMTLQIRSHIEYLVQTYYTQVLIL